MNGAADRMRWSGVAVILTVIGVRVLSEHARIPWWDVDPLVSAIPETRITPWMSMALDALVMASAALVVGAGGVGESVRGRRIGVAGWVLVVIGCAGVLLHGLVLTPYGGVQSMRGDTRSMTIGATWASAVAGGYALWVACADRRVRAACAGVVLGVVAPVCAVGVVQVFVEHAATVRAFEADPAAALLGAGVEPGSPAAASFERRLRQAEATGAFGLANVYGTVAAASAAFWAVMAVGAWRARAGRGVLVAAAGAAVGCAALWLSASKGAAVAAVFGAGVVGAIAMLARMRGSRAWMGRALGVTAIVVPLGAVVARGWVGERIGELSLLFRWHYWQASARIIAEHLWFGVGPGNFKSAYLVAKNPLNPEQVESPHSVIADWVAQLGAFGWAWVILLVCAAGAMGVGAWKSFTTENTEDAEKKTEGAKDREQEAERDERRRGRLVPVVVPMLGAAVAGWVGRETLGPDRALAVGVGVVAWCVMAVWVVRAHARMGAWFVGACAAAGAVALAHGQIEVTPVMAGSAGWWAAVVGIGAARDCGAGGPRQLVRGAVVAIAVAACAVGMAWRVPGLREWERWLQASWKVIDPSNSDSVPDAGHGLFGAWEREPSFVLVGTTAARLIGAGESESSGDRGQIAAGFVLEKFPGRVEAWVARSAALGSTPAGLEALARAAELDPWSVVIPVRIAALHAAEGDAAGAARWARKALENDAWLRLDPVVRMDAGTRARMEALAGGSGAGGRPAAEAGTGGKP